MEPQYFNKYLSGTLPADISMTVTADGTNTQCTLFANGQVQAVGHAKRHRLDGRDPALGAALAIGRALHNLAGLYDADAYAKMHPEPKPALKAKHQELTARRKAQKDERRKAARDAYAAAQQDDADEWLRAAIRAKGADE